MEQDVIQALYEAYGQELYLYLYSLCGQKAAAEDLLQDTFLKAMLSLPRGHGNVRAWLYTVARNLFFNYRKREERESPREELPERFSPDDGMESVLRTERNRLLYQGLCSLDIRKREILEMQYFGGLSLKEIARVLGLSQENVRVQSHRGRKQLKSFMEGHGYDVSGND